MNKIKDRAKFTFNHFGFDNQVRKLDEEHGELTRELATYQEKGFYNMSRTKDYIAQELADNLFLILQFTIGLGIEKEVYEQLDFKSKRTLERIESNYYGNTSK